MSKKNIIYIVIVASILSIMMIAVWGTLPENTNLPPIDYILFNEYDNLNDDGDKLIDVNGDITIQNPVYELKYELSPIESYSTLQVQLSLPSVDYQLDTQAKVIYLFYSLEDIEKEKTLTVTVKDSRTQKVDMVTLWFKQPDVIIIP